MPLFAILIVVIMAAVVYSAIQAGRRTKAAWTEAASQLGIGVISASTLGYPKLAGRIGGTEVMVEVKGSGNNARTRYRITYPPLSPPFSLKRQGGTQRLLQMFGVADVEIGDPTFDTAFAVNTADAAAMAQLLTPARRMTLLRLLAVQPQVQFSHDHAEYTTKGVERDAAKIVTVVQRMVGAAEHLAGKDTTPVIDDAMKDRALGNLGAALQKIREAARAHPEDIDLGVLYAETALSAGDVEASRSTAEKLAEVLGDDATVEGVRQAAARRTTGRDADAPPTPPAATPSAGPGPELFEEIFGSRRLSFETDEIFDRQYRGTKVRWQGKVKSTRPYEKDLDFGSTPGTKAVITVANIESDLYGNAQIDAVVALPPGVRLDRGDEVEFEGVLSKVDPMMRNIFVTEGSVNRG